MAKLFFRYGAMNSGKSTNLLQVHYNYIELGLNPILVKPNLDTKGGNTIVSRLGVNREVDISLNKADNLFKLISNRLEQEKIDCILIDEVQFLSVNQIDECLEIVSKLKIPVICYGLRTDFRVQGFPASERLLLLAHSIEELKTICSCGKKAIINIRKVDGKVTFEGEQVMIDDKSFVEYTSVCSECYFNLKEKFYEENGSTK